MSDHFLSLNFSNIRPTALSCWMLLWQSAVSLTYSRWVSYIILPPQFDIIIVDAAVADPHDRARILAPPPGLLSHGVLASLNKCLRYAVSV